MTPCFVSAIYSILSPVLNSPTTELDSGDWSESDDDDKPRPGEGAGPKSLEQAEKRIKRLESQLAESRSEAGALRSVIAERLDLVTASTSPTIRRKQLDQRDDDTHYFDSYSYNGTFAFVSIFCSYLL